MLRLVHTQAASGAVLINDIDDGLPNKTARRLVAPPKSYERDGYANKIKQKCYVPKKDATDATMNGYIDLQETDRVIMSLNKGVIAGFVKAGILTATLFTSGDVAAPTLAAGAAVLNTTLTLTGTNFTSLAPFTSSVIITGAGAKTLTAAQITTAGGTFTATSIVIPASLLTSVATTTSSVQVKADNQTTAVRVIV